jgi:hypothetical protein
MSVSSIALATEELIKDTSDVLHSFNDDAKLPVPAIADDGDEAAD